MKRAEELPQYIHFFDECIVEKENRSLTQVSPAYLHMRAITGL